HGRKDPFLSKLKSQQKTLKSMVKGTRNILGRYVAKWLYDKGIPFDAVNSPYFPPMVSAIQRVRPVVKSPTAYELSGPILHKEVEEVKNVSRTKKNANFYVRLYDQIVEEVGDKHVVQFITDNARAYVFAGSKLMDKEASSMDPVCFTQHRSYVRGDREINIVKETLEEA
ncbi:hypothetical protein AMTR_s00935p00003380, partial [Amborella trichopoda]